ncbi:D-aspartate oxidase [Infundibulicybe gibba]|nr:D-aspartate oxidase [Infundibulicybe gibba]
MPSIAVIGAGVVEGLRVTIYAQYYPGQKDIAYTSPWAGAHHVSSAKLDKVQQKLDQETFKVMWEMSNGEAKGCFRQLEQTEYYIDEAGYDALSQMPNPLVRYLPKSELPEGAESGGGKTRHCIIQHIDQILEGAFSNGSRPDALVVCAGLGARFLGGVEDKDVFPIRGQTVLLRAPWIDFGRSRSLKDGSWTYVIPRCSGDVIVGGSKAENDWYPHPRPETTQDILRRAIKLCPELSPRRQRDPSWSPSAEDLNDIVIENNCGLRPGRKGGIRLERELVGLRGGQPKFPVVYNYGHSGYGYQSSWGSANVAASLLEGALSQSAPSKL